MRVPSGVATRLATTALILTVACGGTEEPPRPPLRPVRTLEVQPAGSARLRTFAGSVRAGVEARLSFKVAGTIARLPVAVGDRVVPGQLLARLDPADFQLVVQEAQAGLASAEAQARNAEASFIRVSGLYENRNASRADLDAARAARESAAATVLAAKKRLEQAQANLRYTRLTAPAAGAVAEVRAEVNENVKPGDTVVVLASGGPPEVVIAVPEVLISRIWESQPVEVTLDAVPGRTFDGTVTEVGVSSTGLATTFPVTVRMDALARDDSPGIRSGMAAEVAFRFGEPGQDRRILVPSYAVAEDREGRHVWIVKPAGTAQGIVRRRPVKVGELTGEGLEILSGLQEGDLLVTAGVTRMQDGMAVRLP